MSLLNAQQKKLSSLVGGTLVGFVDDGGDENGGRPIFGLLLRHGKKETVLWVFRDPEGNGPGWLEPQKLK